MELGCFSVSLQVKDIAASFAFYQKLGFTPIPGAGKVEDKWIVLQNGDANIGLFEGMLESNLLTFNPKDVRANQAKLQSEGVELDVAADMQTEGPAYLILKDPDGNVIMMDQHY